MFNLIVSGGGWKKNNDTFSRDRIFEYTSDLLLARFKPDGNLDLDQLTRMPTLFMTESGRNKTPLAQIGSVHRIFETGSD